MVMLGKREPKIDARTLKLDKYLKLDKAPPPPRQTNWRGKTGPLSMLLNDKIGICGPAGALHEAQSWINCDGGTFVPTDDMALKAYQDIAGYDPATGKNDNGVYLLDMYNYWIKKGIGPSRLGAYAKLNPKDHGQVMDTVYLFDGLGAGWNLPAAYRSASIWRAPPGGNATGQWQAGSWGGHYAPIVDFDAKYLYVMTWGMIVKAEWSAYDYYCDESYALFSPDWLGSDAMAPNGFDWQSLASDYKDVTGKPAPTPPAPSGKTTIVLSGPPWKVDSVS